MKNFITILLIFNTLYVSAQCDSLISIMDFNIPKTKFKYECVEKLHVFVKKDTSELLKYVNLKSIYIETFVGEDFLKTA